MSATTQFVLPSEPKRLKESVVPTRASDLCFGRWQTGHAAA